MQYYRLNEFNSIGLSVKLQLDVYLNDNLALIWRTRI